jgi:ribosomal protein S10
MSLTLDITLSSLDHALLDSTVNYFLSTMPSSAAKDIEVKVAPITELSGSLRLHNRRVVITDPTSQLQGSIIHLYVPSTVHIKIVERKNSRT